MQLSSILPQAAQPVGVGVVTNANSALDEVLRQVVFRRLQAIPLGHGIGVARLTTALIVPSLGTCIRLGFGGWRFDREKGR